MHRLRIRPILALSCVLFSRCLHALPFSGSNFLNTTSPITSITEISLESLGINDVDPRFSVRVDFAYGHPIEKLSFFMNTARFMQNLATQDFEGLMGAERVSQSPWNDMQILIASPQQVLRPFPRKFVIWGLETAAAWFNEQGFYCNAAFRLRWSGHDVAIVIYEKINLPMLQQQQHIRKITRNLSTVGYVIVQNLVY